MKALSLPPPWIEALLPHQMCSFLALLIKKFLIFHVFCSNFKALVNSILLEESKFSLIHKSFLWKLQWNIFSSLIVQSLLVLGPPQELIFIFIKFLLFIDSIKTRSVEFTSNKLSIYSLLVNFVLPKKFLFEDIYNENQYTRNTWPIHLTTHSKSQSCVLIMREK